MKCIDLAFKGYPAATLAVPTQRGDGVPGGRGHLYGGHGTAKGQQAASVVA